MPCESLLANFNSLARDYLFNKKPEIHRSRNFDMLIKCRSSYKHIDGSMKVIKNMFLLEKKFSCVLGLLQESGDWCMV